MKMETDEKQTWAQYMTDLVLRVNTNTVLNTKPKTEQGSISM